MTNNKKSLRKHRRGSQNEYKYTLSSYSRNGQVLSRTSHNYTPAVDFNSLNQILNYLSYQEPVRHQVVNYEPHYNSYEPHRDEPNLSNINSDGQQDFSLTELTTTSEEYYKVWKYFEGEYYDNIHLYKIENLSLKVQFFQRLTELKERGVKPDTFHLFHDTQSTNVNSICQNNFDERLGRRFKFGPGVYFSTRPDAAFRHSSYKTDSIRAMFLVDVIVNKTVISDTSHVNSDEFDTVICHGGSTYRKNDKAEYVPLYVALYWPRRLS